VLTPDKGHGKDVQGHQESQAQSGPEGQVSLPRVQGQEETLDQDGPEDQGYDDDPC
jgi:hypothetical protein